MLPGGENFHHFNLCDLFVSVLVGFSGVLGLYRGFVRESLGLGSWALSLYFAMKKVHWVSHWLAPWIKKAVTLQVVSSLLVFLISLISLLTLTQIISSFIKKSVIGGVDRFLGLFFGVLRSVFLMVVVYGIILSVLPFQEHPPIIRKSLSAPILSHWAFIVKDYIPSSWFSKTITLKKIQKLSSRVMPSEKNSSKSSANEGNSSGQNT